MLSMVQTGSDSAGHTQRNKVYKWIPHPAGATQTRMGVEGSGKCRPQKPTPMKP